VGRCPNSRNKLSVLITSACSASKFFTYTCQFK